MVVVHHSDAPLTPETGSVWDVVVVGSGMAGSFVADRLATTGASVLVLESGSDSTQPDPKARHLPGRWPSPVRIASKPGARRRPAAAILGHGPGGSSALYGAALERFRAEDFTGARTTAPDALPTDWPVTAEDMAPWYSQAEGRLGVQGGQDPLDPEVRNSPLDIPKLSERDLALVDRLRWNGHRPYRLPVAIAYKPGCSECQGQRCMRACKGEGWQAALAQSSARVAFGAHVTRIQPSPGGETLLSVRLGGASSTVTTKRLVLAAGALNTPRILLASPEIFDAGKPHDMIGRGLMFHASDLFCVATKDALRTDGPKKTLGLRDFYDLPSGRGGEVQSLGFDMSGGLVAQYLTELIAARGLPTGRALHLALRIPGALFAKQLGHQAVLATILEDLPYRDNRLLHGSDPEDPSAPIDIDYAISEELEARWNAMRDAVKRAFMPFDIKFLHRGVAPNLGHPCGSVRMGHDADLCPADATGRLRGTAATIHVVDASLFPSSGGTNPALTVAANALRIAEDLVRN